MKILKDKAYQKGKMAYQSGGVADSRKGQNSTPSGLRSPKSKKVEAHTAPTKYGMGDYYGRAVKAPVGKVREGTVGFRPVTKKQLDTKPRSVA